MDGQQAPAPSESASPKLFDIALGIERFGLIPLRSVWLSIIVFLIATAAAVFGLQRLRVDDSLSQLFRSDTPEFKQFEEVTRAFRRANTTCWSWSKASRCWSANRSRSCATSSPTCSSSTATRGIISLFSARQPPEAGGMPPPLFPEELPEGADYDELIERVMSNEHHPRQAALGGRHARARRARARSRRSSRARKLNGVVADIRKTVAEDIAGAGVSTRAVRRAGHAARDPQRRRARPADLQRDRLRRRLRHRHPVLPARVLHDRRRRAAAARHPAGARRARLARFPPEHVPERDDAADHGDQLLRQHAADLRGARPADRRRGQAHGVPQRHPRGRAGLRADPCDGRRCRSSPCCSPIRT